jgi:hypothetical protein
MNDNNKQSPAQLRTAYQKKAAAYLFGVNSLNSWIGDAARSLALRAVYERSDTSCGQNENGSNSSNDFACLACGTLSYPQETFRANNYASKVIIRSMKRGRTRRRRASRSKAAQLSKEAIQKQRMGNTNTNPQLRKEIIEENQRMKLANLYRIGDGRSKHCVVNKCGFCANEKKRKGVEVKGVQKTGISGKKVKQKQVRESNISSSRQDIEKKDEFKDSNFISLPGNLKKGKAGTTNKAAAPSKIGYSFKQKQGNPPPLLSSGKKKKAKKQPAGSKLMDFLSSLND